MAEIGIRELKAQVSRILEEVRTRGARYVITKRGSPIGMLLPLERAELRAKWEPGEAPAWDELERLGEAIARGWHPDRSSESILGELRS